MSEPILITVANLLCKTRNHLPLGGGGEIGAPLTMPMAASPMKAINSRCLSDHGHRPSANPILRSIPPMTRVPVATR
jgi:hypothetical protein